MIIIAVIIVFLYYTTIEFHAMVISVILKSHFLPVFPTIFAYSMHFHYENRHGHVMQSVLKDHACSQKDSLVLSV